MIVSYAVHNKFSKQNLACRACHGPKRMTTHNHHHHNSNFLLVFFFCGHNNNKPGTTAWSLEYVISLLLWPQLLHKKREEKRKFQQNLFIQKAQLQFRRRFLSLLLLLLSSHLFNTFFLLGLQQIPMTQVGNGKTIP